MIISLLLSLMMILQIVFLVQNNNFSTIFQSADILDESAIDLYESVGDLEESAIKNSYEQVSSILAEKAENQRETALKALISICVYSLLSIILFSISCRYLVVFIKKTD